MSAISARDIIKLALKEIRVLSSIGGQPVDPEVEQDAFNDLNRMLESWSLENLMVPADVEESETLTANQSSYTVGSSGNFNTGRPLEIRDDAVIQDTGGTDYRVRVLTIDVYRGVANKATGGRPRFLSYQPEFPLGIIYLYPTPDNSTDTLNYNIRGLLDSFVNVTTSVNFPPGYEQAIISNLSLLIAPRNGKRAGDIQITVAKAQVDKARIKQQNSAPVQPVKMRELARITGGRRPMDILSGPFHS